MRADRIFRRANVMVDLEHVVAIEPWSDALNSPCAIHLDTGRTVRLPDGSQLEDLAAAWAALLGEG